MLQQTPPYQQADAATAGTGFPGHSMQSSAVPGRNGDRSASSSQEASPPDHSVDAGLQPVGSTSPHFEDTARFSTEASSNGSHNSPSEGSTPVVPSDRAAQGIDQLASGSNSSRAHETSANVGPAATSRGSHSTTAALASRTPSTESGSEAAHVHEHPSVATGSHSSQATAASEPLSKDTPAQAAGSQPQTGIPGAHRSAVTDDSDGAQTDDRNMGPGWLQHEEVYLPCDEDLSPMNYVVYSEEPDEEEDQDGLLCKLVFEVRCFFVGKCCGMWHHCRSHPFKPVTPPSIMLLALLFLLHVVPWLTQSISFSAGCITKQNVRPKCSLVHLHAHAVQHSNFLMHSTAIKTASTSLHTEQCWRPHPTALFELSVHVQSESDLKLVTATLKEGLGYKLQELPVPPLAVLDEAVAQQHSVAFFPAGVVLAATEVSQLSNCVTRDAQDVMRVAHG